MKSVVFYGGIGPWYRSSRNWSLSCTTGSCDHFRCSSPCLGVAPSDGGFSNRVWFGVFDVCEQHHSRMAVVLLGGHFV